MAEGTGIDASHLRGDAAWGVRQELRPSLLSSKAKRRWKQMNDPAQSSIRERDWVHVLTHQATGKVIEKSFLWGNTSFRVWLPSTDSIIRVSPSQLAATQSSALSPDHLSYVAAAARVADALTQDVLLAPIESSVIPLPHQIRALSRAIANDRVRYLLADEVGLVHSVSHEYADTLSKTWAGIGVRTAPIEDTGLLESPTLGGSKFPRAVPIIQSLGSPLGDGHGRFPVSHQTRSW